ncbi:hypothetical protein GW17_00011828 [Ensete ventricosum]|nr:hypothetical protein GW17_00011828 [Ensete ventricosum]
MKSVAVVGGGVSGLAAAYKLKSNGLNVTLFDAEERAGGKIKSSSENGLIWDEGANTMVTSYYVQTESEREVGRLIDTLSLREKLQIIPLNPVGLIMSNILSTKSKVLWGSSFDVILEKRWNLVVDYLIDPFVAGTSAGDPESLSVSIMFMRHAFPELWNLEKK